MWFRDDFRGRGLLAPLGRLAFALAWVNWSPDFIYSLVAEWYIKKRIFDRSGHCHREPHGSVLRLPTLGIDDDEWLLWTTRDELLKMLSNTSEVAREWENHVRDSTLLHSGSL